MKKIIFVLLGFFIWQSALSQVSSTTGAPFYLPQWASGNKLNAGTQNDSSLGNAGLNSALARINKILGRQVSTDGYFTTIYGDGTGNLVIDAGRESATPVRIFLSDSLYGVYNWQTAGDLLVQGNTTVGGNIFAGGYMTTDSILATNIIGDSLISNGGMSAWYDIQSITGGLISGTAGGERSGFLKLNLEGASSAATGMYLLPTNGDYKDTLYLPALNNKTLATIDGGQTFTSLTSSGIIKTTTTGTTGFVANTNISGNPYFNLTLGDTLRGSLYWDRPNAFIAINNTGQDLILTTGGNISTIRNEMATWLSNKSADGETDFMNNAYYSSGFKRRYADQASRIQFIDGKIVFSTAGYGAANSAITWTDAGTIDTTGKSRFDSLGTNKIVFTGVAPPVQSYALGADSTNRRLLYTSYQVQRAVDLTHAVITADVLDSNSVRETVLDSVQMAANFPSVGKVVRIVLLGNYTLTGSGTCIIRIRHRNGATSDTTGTVLDSLILTNIASDKGLNLIATTTFRTTGATGSAVSFLRAETGTTIVTGGNVVGATTINTTTNNTLYITSKRSVTSDKVKIRQGWAETKN